MIRALPFVAFVVSVLSLVVAVVSTAYTRRGRS